MITSFRSQFKYPQGVLGHVVGWIMALKNRERNAWAIALLEPQLRDQVLEIGFEKVLAVNSMQFWPDAVQGLAEVKRVLKPGGRAVITIQPMWVKTDDEARAVGGGLHTQLTQAGFRQIRLKTLPLKPLVLSGIGLK